jgi:hypothetical protein
MDSFLTAIWGDDPVAVLEDENAVSDPLVKFQQRLAMDLHKAAPVVSEESWDAPMGAAKASNDDSLNKCAVAQVNNTNPRASSPGMVKCVLSEDGSSIARYDHEGKYLGSVSAWHRGSIS